MVKPVETAQETDGTWELVEKAKAGDDEAFGALVSAYEVFVYHMAIRVLTASGGSASDGEDVAQEVFIKAWRSLESFRGDCAFSTWLYRITVNTAKDKIRSGSRHRTISLTTSDEDGEEIVIDVPVTAADEIPEAAYERRENIKAVRQAIEKLPEDMRRILILRDLEDLPYSDIADLLGLEIGTVKSRLNRSRAALKKILKDGNFF
ncbi:MAG: sigma-70 family RNA polymerase sigma factor [Clostridia bacterium]|nr:sigma-70 family RNA polymerase sigma factor [Clostridia bacterium]